LLPVSLWASFDVHASLPKALGLLLGFAIFYATRMYIDGPGRLRQVLLAYLLLGTAIAAAALVGTQWLEKNPLLSAALQRAPLWIRGLPGAARGFHPNEIAGVLLWFVPLQLALSVWCLQHRAASLSARAALLISTLCTTSALILTQSRGALLGLTIGLAMMIAQGRTWARAALLVVCILLLLLVAARGPSWITKTLSEGIAPETIGRSNWEFRVVVWRAALWGIGDFPLTGMGIGAFRYVARVLYPLRNVHVDFDYAHAHNGFLQAALDFGILGLVAYVCLWLVSAQCSLQSLSHTTGWLRAAALGLWGCLVSSFIYHLTDTVALGAKGGLPWWMMLALIAALPTVTDFGNRLHHNGGSR
jgi:O-antigen ligase